MTRLRWVAPPTVIPGIGQVETGGVYTLPKNCEWMLAMSGWEEVEQASPQRRVRKPADEKKE
jgi:hypothetical protein